MKKKWVLFFLQILTLFIFSCSDDISKTEQIFGKIRIEYSNCTGCNECITDFSCPENAIKIDTATNTNYIDMTKCVGCMKCVDDFNCRFDAFTVKKDIACPSTVIDLTSKSSTDTSIAFTWSAPSDDNDSLGRAYKYIVKFSTDSIKNTNWNEYSTYSTSFLPNYFSDEENLLISNLIPETKYFIAIKSIDESNNISQISNIYSKSTLALSDLIAPSAITDLSSSVTIGKISLNWTAPGDDGNIGTATNYIIKVSTDSVTNNNWNEINEYPNSIQPKESGNTENFGINNLIAQTKYFVGIKSIDESGNISLISNITSQITPAIDDIIPPSSISDLSSISNETNVTINWTAPGDDGDIGTATKYIIKVSTDNITNANWDQIDDYPNTITPKEAGNAEIFEITGLSSQTQYFVGIKSVDDAGNISLISNIISNSLISDTTPPSAITDLSIIEGTTSSLTQMELTWTAPGDDNNTGTATSYIIKYSSSQITEANFNSATAITNNITPTQAGNQENFVVTGLTMAEIYYFAIETTDDVGNISLISNNTAGKTVYQVLPNKCTGCGRCVNHCPENAITMPGYDAVIDPDKCTACGTCVNWCPHSAIVKTVVKYQ